MSGFSFEAWTLPTAGAFTRKYHLTRHIASYSLTERWSGPSSGACTLTDNYPNLDTLLKVDEANHANDEGTVLRVTQDGVPVGHYVITAVEDTWDDRNPTANIVLAGMEELVDKARVLAYDYPANPTTDPDWIYGADTVLTAIGGETANELQEIWVNATSGTYTITDGTDTTAAIAWDASASTIQTRLETDLTGVTSVRVSGTGALKTPYEIEFVDPISYPQLTIGTNSTNGVISVSTTREGGSLSERPWHKSFNPVSGQEHGNYQTFQISQVQVPPGDTYSLAVDIDSVRYPADYAGAQQIVKVTPGATYRATCPVYAPTTGRRFRLVIRDLNENLIAVSPDITVPADTWYTLDAGSFTIPAGVDQVIYRIGILETTNIPTVYVGIESALFAPGFPAAPLGQILNELLAPANTRGVLTWLTPTWTNTLDSAGNAWNESLAWGIKRGQSFLQLLEYAAKWGYEWRIRWDVGNSRFEWDVFNPNGGGSDLSAAVAITGRDGGVESGPIVRRMPDFTYAVAEGDAGNWGESENAVLTGAWGRLESYFGNKQGRAGLASLATQLVAQEVERSSGRRVRLITPTSVPWVDYQPGDTVTLNLSPKDTKQPLRVEAVTAAQSGLDAAPVYDIHLASMTWDPDTAMAEAVRGLIRKFEGIENIPQGDGTVEPAFSSGGGTIPWFVASFQAPANERAVAQYFCDGVNDEVEIQAAIDDCAAAGGGTVWLSSGWFYVESHKPVAGYFVGGAGIDLKIGVGLRGVGGWAQTQLGFDFTYQTYPTTDVICGVLARWNGDISDIWMEVWDDNPGGGVELCTLYANSFSGTVERCFVNYFGRDGYAMWVKYGANPGQFINTWFEGDDLSWGRPVIEMAGTWNKSFVNCFVQYGSASVRLDGVAPSAGRSNYRHTFYGCSFTEGYTNGVEIERCTNLIIQSCHFLGTGDSIQGSPAGTEAALQIVGYAADAIAESLFVDNTFKQAFDEPMIRVENTRSCIIGRNIMDEPFDEGIRVQGANKTLQIHSNAISWTNKHAIHLAGCSDVHVTDNQILYPGSGIPANTYDGIILSGDANRNYLRGNKVVSWPTSKARYGINVSAATCDDNIYVGNECRPAADFGTNPYNDAGTGTIITWPATASPVGDNF